MGMPEIITYRYESFGGIIHLRIPSALVYVDKDYMLSLGYSPSPLWDSRTDLLSAPTEVHMAVTNHCSNGCDHCYMDSRDRSDSIRDGIVDGELGPAGLRKAADVLARMRVFHVALGGGESFEMPWLMELVGYIRSKGIVPNITSNGHFIDEGNAILCRDFGQINLSLDDVGPDLKEPAARRHFEKADRAFGLLRKAGVRAGINCVVTRRNFDRLEQIVRYAKKKRLLEIEFLRFKPSGRARQLYHDLKLTPRQAGEFYPRVMELMKRHGVTLKLDCSFTPFICVHEPDPGRMDFFSVVGCDGGNQLMGAFADGRTSPCSFAAWEDLRIRDMPAWWRRAGTFEVYRNWPLSAPEPCSICRYLSICRGGCHAVSEFYFGDARMADPECPRVQLHRPILQ